MLKAWLVSETKTTWFLFTLCKWSEIWYLWLYTTEGRNQLPGSYETPLSYVSRFSVWMFIQHEHECEGDKQRSWLHSCSPRLRLPQLTLRTSAIANTMLTCYCLAVHVSIVYMASYVNIPNKKVWMHLKGLCQISWRSRSNHLRKHLRCYAKGIVMWSSSGD